MTRILGALALIALIAVTALAGRSYRWCIPAARVAAGCCAGVSAEETTSSDAIRPACCEDRAFGRLPASDPRAQAPIVPAAPLSHSDVTVLAFVAPQAPPAPPDRQSARAATRARAGPLTSNQRCNVLQVFRC